MKIKQEVIGLDEEKATEGERHFQGKIVGKEFARC